MSKRERHVSLGWEAYDVLAPSLTNPCFKVFITLLREADYRTGVLRGSSKWLAPKVGMSAANVARILGELERLELVEWTRGVNVDSDGVITIIGYDWWTGVAGSTPSGAAVLLRRTSGAPVAHQQRILASLRPSDQERSRRNTRSIEAVKQVQTRDSIARSIHDLWKTLQDLSEEELHQELNAYGVEDLNERFEGPFGFKVRDHAGLQHLGVETTFATREELIQLVIAVHRLNGRRLA